MTDKGLKQAAIIIGAGLVLMALIFAFANRYQPNSYGVIVDRWTGHYKH